ncbi:hypothetical protein [Ktedonospora formicarum]|uniref:Uncharacterized protein n=1 Tax=Ktedonospora formicarum TaxID=2778364 RepID=A0A8J3I363_9CHLR|nr:hypothetical protein [Ktedonospora formicarum]GHO45168.1 hypothetical protein KSX_33310 [Ktedonospora formicarum]
MLHWTLIDLAGVRVHRHMYHTHCAPDGPTSPMYTTDEGVERLHCRACGLPLVLITDAPELEEIDDAGCCAGCGDPLSADADSEFCSESCAWVAYYNC